MKPTFWQRLDALARYLSPFAVASLLLLDGSVPIRLPHLAEIGPNFALISVYYWAVHRPTVLPPFAVFVGSIETAPAAQPAQPLSLRALGHVSRSQDGAVHHLAASEAAWIDTDAPFSVDSAEAWLALDLDTP